MAGFQLTYLICCRARSPSCFSTPFHHIFSCSGLHSQVPFFFFFKHFSKNCLIFSRQFLYSFNVSSSTSLYCCLLLPTTSSASPQLRPLRASGGSPQAGTRGSHRHSKAAARLLRETLHASTTELKGMPAPSDRREAQAEPEPLRAAAAPGPTRPAGRAGAAAAPPAPARP